MSLNEKCHQIIKNTNYILIYINIYYWYGSHLKKCQYRIVIAHLICIKFKRFQGFYLVKNVLKLEWPINERHYLTLARCGEGNSVIKNVFMKLEILSGLEDARICITFLNDDQGFHWNSRKYYIDNDYL